MSDDSGREWRFYFDDMIGFAELWSIIKDEVPLLLTQLVELKGRSG